VMASPKSRSNTAADRSSSVGKIPVHGTKPRSRERRRTVTDIDDSAAKVALLAAAR